VRWGRCRICDQRGHRTENCPSASISPEAEKRIWRELQANPYFQEETTRRRAAKALGNNPDKPARVPRWRRRRDGR
jgi:hypothetical protein